MPTMEEMEAASRAYDEKLKAEGRDSKSRFTPLEVKGDVNDPSTWKLEDSSPPTSKFGSLGGEERRGSEATANRQLAETAKGPGLGSRK